MRSDSQIALASDGRTLTFAEWGDPNGFPVFSLHGTPNSRFARHWDETKYSEAGARVITYDRPGYGGSDRHPGRSVVDCVGDVAAIADTLGIERFAVTGAWVVYGLTDVLVPVQHGEWLAHNVRDSEVVAENDLGHLGSPDRITELYGWLVRPV